MEADNNFGKLLDQIELLIKHIHRAGEKAFKFYSEGDRSAKNSKLKLVIAEVSGKVNSTLAELLVRLR